MLAKLMHSIYLGENRLGRDSELLVLDLGVHGKEMMPRYKGLSRHVYTEVHVIAING